VPGSTEDSSTESVTVVPEGVATPESGETSSQREESVKNLTEPLSLAMRRAMVGESSGWLSHPLGKLTESRTTSSCANIPPAQSTASRIFTDPLQFLYPDYY
jgi:hypothetical protein